MKKEVYQSCITWVDRTATCKESKEIKEYVRVYLYECSECVCILYEYYNKGLI